MPEDKHVKYLDRRIWPHVMSHDMAWDMVWEVTQWNSFAGNGKKTQSRRAKEETRRRRTTKVWYLSNKRNIQLRISLQINIFDTNNDIFVFVGVRKWNNSGETTWQNADKAPSLMKRKRDNLETKLKRCAVETVNAFVRVLFCYYYCFIVVVIVVVVVCLFVLATACASAHTSLHVINVIRCRSVCSHVISLDVSVRKNVDWRNKTSKSLKNACEWKWTERKLKQWKWNWNSQNKKK